MHKLHVLFLLFWEWIMGMERSEVELESRYPIFGSNLSKNE